MARDRKIIAIAASEAGRTAFDPNRPSNLPAPLLPIKKLAVDFVKAGLTNLFDNADDSLFEMADRATSNTEQTLFFEAMRAVRLQRHQITKTCCNTLMEELEELNLTSEAAKVTTLHNFEIDTLSLVQPDELEETVALDSMIGRVVSRSNMAMAQLAIRMNSLVKNRVDERSNPLGPTALSEVFAASLAELDLDIKVRLIIFKLFERYVFNELDALYQEANRQLIMAGVLPDLKEHAGSPIRQRKPAQAAEEFQHGGQRGGHGGGDSYGDHQHVLSMFSELIGNWRHASGDAAMSRIGSPSAETLPSNELLGMLAHMPSTEWSDSPLPRQDMRAQINQLLHQQQQHGGQAKALDRVDDDVISLVSMLFDFILDDTEVPSALKAMIGRLQLPILRVAIADKRFFSQSSHPARRLLNELARSTMGWGEHDDLRRDQLHALLESIVQRLLDEPDPEPELFARLHTELTGFVNVEKRRSERLEQRTRDAEEGKARIESARAQVAIAINSLLLGKTLPVFVVDLLRDTWSQVMQITCLREGADSARWDEVHGTAEQLLQCILPLGDESAKEREQLNARVRQALAEGFQSIGLRAEQGAPLLVRLQQLQQACFPVPQAAPVPVLLDRLPDTAETGFEELAEDAEPTAPSVTESAELLSDAAVFDLQDGVSDEEPTAPSSPASSTESVAPVSASVSSQAPVSVIKPAPAPEVVVPVLTVPTVHVDEPVMQAPEPEPEPELVGQLPDVKASAWVSALHTGSWFDLMNSDEEASQRCKLAAIISFSGKYIFVNRSGMKVAEYTASSLAQHFEAGLIRLLDDSQLFDRALESVIGNLRHLQSGKN
ncbi:MAG: DUF1631 domain-containing protein [Pseudomonas sp.]